MSDTPLEAAARPLVVLNMIVRNEGTKTPKEGEPARQPVIERCLQYALPHVDAAVIVDTGSTDDTIAVVERTLVRHRKPGLVVSHAWQDFGTNRTLAYETARAWLEEQRAPLDETYLLLLDADMVFTAPYASWRNFLQRPLYRLFQQQGSMRYPNTRLIRLSHQWVCIEPTHEYWCALPDVGIGIDLQDEKLVNHEEGSLASLTAISCPWIDDRNDGGNKDDKHQRDIQLLKQALEKNPRNPRALFYIADTHFWAERFSEAFDYYGRRIAVGGWDEEVWLSRMRQGLSLLKMGKPSQRDEMIAEAFRSKGLEPPPSPAVPPDKEALEERGVGILLDAFQRRPSRAEPLAELAQFYRETGKHQLALLFARAAMDIPMSKDSLFVDVPSYTYRPFVEFGISSFYLDQKDLCFFANEYLLAMRNVPYETYEMAARNQLFCIPEEAEHVAHGRFEVPEELRTFDGIVYETSSPTILEHGDTLLVNVRLVNYNHERGRWFVPKHKDGKSRTESVVLTFDNCPIVGERAARVFERQPDMVALSQARVPEGWEWERSKILGLEDQRWFWFDDGEGERVWFTSTCAQVPGQTQPQVVLGRFSRDRMDGLDRLVHLRYVDETGELRNNICEKNWIPWVVAGKLYLLYWYDPLTVLDVNTRTGVCTKAYLPQAIQQSFSSVRWRGSVSPIRWGEVNYLMLVHERVHRANDNVYLHRWVELSCASFSITRYSQPFSFHHHGVEYALGMVERGDHVIVSYGAEERESHWMAFDADAIEASLLTPGMHEKLALEAVRDWSL